MNVLCFVLYKGDFYETSKLYFKVMSSTDNTSHTIQQINALVTNYVEHVNIISSQFLSANDGSY